MNRINFAKQNAPYSNVRDARFELKEGKNPINSAIPPVVDDVQMLGFLRMASERIVNMTELKFEPYVDTKTYGERGGWRIGPNNGTLYLPEPLLAITQVTDGNGTVLVYGTDFMEDPPNIYPVTALKLLQVIWPVLGTCATWYNTCGLVNQKSLAQVTGIWGYHQDYPNAYADTFDTVQDHPLLAISTNMHVTDADGVDSYGRTPRFSPGQLLKVEDELLALRTVDTTTNILGVLRGANGTTAVDHPQNTAIDVYEVDFAIAQAVNRWAGYPYKRRGQYESSQFDASSGVSINFPQATPGDVLSILNEFMGGLSF